MIINPKTLKQPTLKEKIKRLLPKSKEEKNKEELENAIKDYFDKMKKY